MVDTGELELDSSLLEIVFFLRPQTNTDTTTLIYLSTERKSISRTETK